MFRDGCSLEDISSVTGMEIELIKKQLEFVVSRKYLSSEMKLTDLGDHLLSIQDFLVECGRSKPIFAMEHYIENPEEKKNILLSLINNKQILVNYCQ
jgi:hypothetical protein